MFSISGGSSGASGSGARKKNLKSHVWNYFSREPTDDPTRIKIHCLICIEKSIVQEPFTMRKGGGTGTLNRHLVEKHGISKESHESGEARGESSLHQTQIGSFMSSNPGGGMPFSYYRERMINDFATYVTLDELPFHMVKALT